MMSDLVMVLLDVINPFEMQFNALDFTLGRGILQDDHFVAYKSKK